MGPAVPPLDAEGVFNLATQEPTHFLGQFGSLRFWINPQGHRIATYFWPGTTSDGASAAPQPRGIIMLVHGHGSYLCYDYLKMKEPGQLSMYSGSWVEGLNMAGYSVVGIDNQGAGRSDGIRCYADTFDHYLEDVIYVARNCTEMDVSGFSASTPRFIMGCSLGGCMSTMAGLKAPELFAGVILLAPMLSLEKISKQGLNPYLRPLASAVSLLVPTLPVAKTMKNLMYPDLQRAYDLDPHCWHNMTRARNASEYLRVCAWLMANIEAVNFPFLVIHSERDTMCDCDGSKQLYLRASSHDKTLRLMNSMWHILTKEPGGMELLATEVLPWINKRAADARAGTEEPRGSGAKVLDSHAHQLPSAGVVGVTDNKGSTQGGDL